jgi:alpha-beta hydrolase superfamily lysophospholipase
VRDVHEVGAALRAHAPVPRILFGHSMGSFVVRHALLERPADLAGCALSGSSALSRALARLGAALAALEALRVGRAGASPLLHWLVFGRAERAFAPRRTAFDWLSRDAAEVDAYLADPLCGFSLRAGSLADMFRALAAAESTEALRTLPAELPILVLAGSDDPLSGATAVHRLAGLYARAGLERVSTRVYPGSRHEPHNDLDGQQVQADLLVWIEACLGPATGLSRGSSV